MRRREFLGLLGGAMATWPVVARAQQADRVRRIGLLMGLSSNDAEAKARTDTFVQELTRLGWIDGTNLRIEYRWGESSAEKIRAHATELVALAPDVILATGSSTVGLLLQLSNTIPIVFATVVDPVGAGFVSSLARPGGNATGFTVFEYGISGKWLELLKAIAPNVTRAAVIRDATVVSGIGQFAAIQGAAPPFGIEVTALGMRSTGEIERDVAEFARRANGGLVVVAGTAAVRQRDMIVALAARHRLPTVYADRAFVTSGGLASYGPDRVEPYRDAARYVDRILKGEKPADLPVQAPTKYELVINLKTPKTLGITVPPTLLARADEVIE